MVTMLGNLRDIPMGDDYMSGIVNRKSAIEQRLEAKYKATQYGKEKKVYPKNYQDDRNKYEKSYYGQIPYSGMGADAPKKPVSVIAKPTPTSVIAKAAPKSVIKPVVKSMPPAPIVRRIKKKARKERGYTGMGGIKEMWGSLKSKLGMGDSGIGDADFGDSDFGSGDFGRISTKRKPNRKAKRVSGKKRRKYSGFGGAVNFGEADFGDFGDYGLGAKKKAVKKAPAKKAAAPSFAQNLIKAGAGVVTAKLAPKAAAVVVPSGNPMPAAPAPKANALDNVKNFVIANKLYLGIGGGVLIAAIVGFKLMKKSPKQTQAQTNAKSIADTAAMQKFFMDSAAKKETK